MLRNILNILNSKEKIYFCYILILMIIGMCLETLGIGLIMPIILMFLKGKESLIEFNFLSVLNNFFINNDVNQIIQFILIIFLIIYFFKYLFLIFLYFVQYNFSEKVLKRISKKIYKNYLYKPYSFYLSPQSSKKINSLIIETNIFIEGGLESLMLITSEFFIFFGILLFLLYISFYSSILILVIIFIPTVIFYLIIKTKTKYWSFVRQKFEEVRLKSMQQTLISIKEIKIFDKENFFFNIFSNTSDQVFNIRKKMQILNQIPRVWLEVLAILSFVILIFFLFNILESEKVVSMLAVYSAAAFRIMPSLNRIMIASQALRYSYASTERIYQELQYLSEDNLKGIEFKNLINKDFQFLKIVNLSFFYNKNHNILEKINFEIKMGDFIGIVGTTGSGKSTLVDIICGLINPVSGSIIYNGKFNIQEDIKGWQSNIGYAPQTINLFDDTIENNITFNENSPLDEKSLIRSVKICELEEFINNQPNKIQTIIGERGCQLSGGQRQRIAIARAIYKLPKILILDEATNALDSITAEKVITNIINDNKDKKMTTIMITHKENQLNKCNKILRIKKGKIEFVKYEK